MYKEFHELLIEGVNVIVDLEHNRWGFRNRVVELKNGDQYEYVPEENRYRKSEKPRKLNVAHL